MNPQTKNSRGHRRAVGDAVQRSLGRARAVETPEHLADAARDAYLLAEEVRALTQQVDNLQRFKREVQRTVRGWV